MAFKIRLTDPALADLEEILSYSWQNFPATTMRFGEGLYEYLEILQDFPNLGKPVIGRLGVGMLVHSPILIYYRVLARVEAVEILEFRISTNLASQLRQQRQTALHFVGFMLGDFDAALRSGSTSARKALLDEILINLKQVSPGSAEDPEIRELLFKAYLIVGGVQCSMFESNLGDSAGANGNPIVRNRVGHDRGGWTDIARKGRAQTLLADNRDHSREAHWIEQFQIPAVNNRRIIYIPRHRILSSLARANAEPARSDIQPGDIEKQGHVANSTGM